MVKGYDPNKYISDLTASVEGLDSLLGAVDEKITKAGDQATKKQAAANEATAKVDALKAEKAQLQANRTQASRLLATAKGEPVATDVADEQDALPV